MDEANKLNNMGKCLKRVFGMTVATMLMSFSAMATAYATPNNDDAILMSVNGDKYSSEATTPVLMTLEGKEQGSSSVIVPGDVLKGSLTVKNNGESHGVLKAYLVSDNESPDELKLDEWFNGDVMVSANGVSGPLISWAPASQGGNATPVKCTDVMGVKILDEKIKKNKTVDIDLSLEFDADAVSGNSAGSDEYAAGERSSELTLYLTLTGDTNGNSGNNGKNPGKNGNNGNPGNNGKGNDKDNGNKGNNNGKGNNGNGNGSGKSAIGSVNGSCGEGDTGAPVEEGNNNNKNGEKKGKQNNKNNGKDPESSSLSYGVSSEKLPNDSEENSPKRADLGAVIIENPFAAAGIIGILAIAIGSTIFQFNNRKN